MFVLSFALCFAVLGPLAVCRESLLLLLSLLLVIGVVLLCLGKSIDQKLPAEYVIKQKSGLLHLLLSSVFYDYLLSLHFS